MADDEFLDARTGGERNPVSKALKILSWMAESEYEEVGVRHIASSLGFATGTTHRLLATLESTGVVNRTGNGKYRLGLEMMRIGWKVSERFSVVDVARPFLEELVSSCNETACLGLYDRSREQMMFALVVDADNPLRYVIKRHEWIPLHSGAGGLAILAFLPPGERSALLRDTDLKPVTELTLTDPELIEQEAARIRDRGYGLSHGQRILGAVGIAAPIWGPAHNVIGDVLVTIPEHRFGPGTEEAVAPQVVAAASKITAKLQSSPGAHP